MNKIRNEKGEVTTDNAEIQRIIRNYLVHFSHSVVSDSLRPHESQHTRPPCPSSTPSVHPNSQEKRDRNQIKIKNEKGKVTTDNVEIQRIMRPL